MSKDHWEQGSATYGCEVGRAQPKEETAIIKVITGAIVPWDETQPATQPRSISRAEPIIPFPEKTDDIALSTGVPKMSLRQDYLPSSQAPPAMTAAGQTE